MTWNPGEDKDGCGTVVLMFVSLVISVGAAVMVGRLVVNWWLG